MNKIHLITEQQPFHRGIFYRTLCGLEGSLARDTRTEFDTAIGNRFEAVGIGEYPSCRRCKASLLKLERA